MIKPHHNIRYIKARLRQIIYQKLNPDAPWLTRESINLLDQLIKPSDKILEFGSGRSTKWLADRCSHITSVEHDVEWYEFVNEKVDKRKVQLLWKSLNDLDQKESDYIKILNSFESESFDIILNDGKLRDYVAINSIDKLKKGGIYILDNAERYIPNKLELPESMGANIKTNKRWIKFYEEIQDWRKIWTVDGVSSTLILFKI